MYRIACAILGACSILCGAVWLKASLERDGFGRELVRAQSDLARERDEVARMRRQAEDLSAKLSEANVVAAKNLALLEAGKTESAQLREKSTQLSEQATKSQSQIEKLQAAVAAEGVPRVISGDVFMTTQAGGVAKITGAKVGVYSKEMFEAQEAIDDLRWAVITTGMERVDSSDAVKQKTLDVIKRTLRVGLWKSNLGEKTRALAVATSDADGRFSVSFAGQHKDYVVVCFGERKVLGTPEEYVWKMPLRGDALPKTISLGPNNITLAKQGTGLDN